MSVIFSPNICSRLRLILTANGVPPPRARTEGEQGRARAGAGFLRARQGAKAGGRTEGAEQGEGARQGSRAKPTATDRKHLPSPFAAVTAPDAHRSPPRAIVRGQHRMPHTSP